MHGSVGGPGPRGAVVVGASQAGVQLAVSLREGGYDEPITLLGAEPHLPYQRPPLSKRPVASSGDAASIALRSESFYRDRGIELQLGDPVLAARRDEGGGQVETAGGSRLSFRHLALTVGARPRALPVPGADLTGVLHLRDVDDAIALWSRIRGAQDVVIVGAGFVGLEAAAVARSTARSVTVVEAGTRVLSRAVHPVVSEACLAAHQRRGVQILLDAQVDRIVEDGRGRVRSVHLRDGRTLPADLVVVGVGATPRTELAQSMGLECDEGIVVDASSRTSDGVTVAAGDCVSMPHPVPGESGRCRIESVNNAVEQAKNAAATLLGEPTPYELVPWFWSDQGDLKLQMVGSGGPGDRLVVRGEPEAETFTVLHFRDDDRLVAAECLNRPVDFMAARAALSRGLTVQMAGAENPAVPLKSLLVEKRRILA